MNKKIFFFTVKDITEIAVFCAIAIALDTFVKIQIGLGGGSVSIAMVPLIFISLHKGWFKGFIAGAIIFGISTCILDGYGFACYPFDYFIGFGSVALVGALRKFIVTENVTFKNYLIYAISIIMCMFIRFVGSTISGIVIFETDLVPSMIYQLEYIVPTTLANVILCILSLPAFLPFLKRD